MNRDRVLIALISFVAGLVVAGAGPLLIRSAAARLIFPERRTEMARITSPDGTVDAVAERIDCGAPCSSGYAVSVVPKGTAAPSDSAQWVFLAEDTVNARVQWKQPHLLDIGYDKALIHNFHNVAYPLGRTGKVESWQYTVEIHLSPSSSHFSYLRDGNVAASSR